jgi:hypothetical protein
MRINITHRLIITGDDAMRLGEHGISFTTRVAKTRRNQKHPLMVRGRHALWLGQRRESLQIHWSGYLEECWLEFRSDHNACEFKLLFL